MPEGDEMRLLAFIGAYALVGFFLVLDAVVEWICNPKENK